MNRKTKAKKMTVNIKRFGIFLLSAALITYVAYTLINQHIKLSQREDVASKIEEEISDKELEQEQLNKELENSESDDYLEKMSREKLGLVKPNERVFVDVTRE